MEKARMVRSWILYILWLACAFALFAVTQNVFCFALLITSAAIPLIMAFLAKISLRRIDAFITAERSAKKNSGVMGRLNVRNTGPIAADRIRCHIFYKNLLTGAVKEGDVRIAAPLFGGSCRDMAFDCPHAGRLCFTVPKISLVSAFGLFAFEKKLTDNAPALSLVFPDVYPVELQISYGESANLDSDEYSQRKPGNDPSETFRLRPYVQGDRIRQIHWKLTEKLDDLIVRDYGLPIQNTVLLLLETGIGNPDPDAMDALAGGLVSVSQALVADGVMHTIGWHSGPEGEFKKWGIESEDDIRAMLPYLLSASPEDDPMSVTDHYLETTEQPEFAHIVIFTVRHDPGVAAVSGRCIVTEVICSAQESGNDYRDGAAVTGAQPGALAEIMGYLEI